MRPQHHQAFLHWPHRQIGDVATNHATSALLRRLFSAGRLPAPRARLYRDIAGLRQALSIDLIQLDRHSQTTPPVRSAWLVEQNNHHVVLSMSPGAPALSTISGSILHQRQVLDPDGAWVKHVAKSAAARTLGLRRDAIGADAALRRDYALLVQVEYAVLRTALSVFRDGLDAEVLTALQAEGCALLETYNYYWQADGAYRRNRIQAARSFPSFSRDLREDAQLRQSVDQGTALLPQLAARYNLSTRTIKHVRASIPADVAPEQQIQLLRQLDCLPAEYVPKTTDDWRVFQESIAPLSDLAEAIDTDVATLARPFANGWRAGAQALSAKCGGTVGETLPFADIFDLMQATYQYGVRPALEQALSDAKDDRQVVAAPPPAFFPLWFGRYGLRRLAEMALRWQQAYQAFSLERLGNLDPAFAAQLVWAPLLPAAASDGSFRIVELTSQQALELEGRKQRHCLASYAGKCLDGDSAIYSIRDRLGNVLSTFEVGLAQNKAEVLQHSAFENNRPSRALRSVATRFVEQRISALPTSRLAAARAARQSSGRFIRGRLARTNTAERVLDDGERARLRELVAFAHPAAAVRQGLFNYVLEHAVDLAAFGLVKNAEMPRENVVGQR